MAKCLVLLHKDGEGLVLLDYNGIVMVGVGAVIVQLLLPVIHHEAEMIHVMLQLWVSSYLQWLYHSITPCAVLKASTLDLIDALPTQTGKRLLHSPGELI